NVSAHLADPDRFSFESKRRNPQPEMKSLVNGLSRFLQSKILASPIDIERTYWRIPVSAAAHERTECAPTRLQVDHFGLVPAGAKAVENSRELANHHQI